MARETAPIRDPRSLRAFAHPARMRLYEALLAGGPATASQLASEVPGAPGSLSYHLRTLAAHGFVEDAPELASDGRERWWRAVPGGAHWAEEDLDRSPGLREAATAAQMLFLSRQQERLRDWLRSESENFGPQWRSAAVSSDVLLLLTSEELHQLGRDLEAVADRWLQHSRARRQVAGDPAPDPRRDPRDEHTNAEGKQAHDPWGTPDLRPVLLVLHAFPFLARGEAPVLKDEQTGPQT